MERAATLLCFAYILSFAVVAAAGEYSFFHGDLHSHTGFSDNDDNISTPADAYAHARDVAGLDFYCVTDHFYPEEPDIPESLSTEEYAQLKGMADVANQDDSFVTLYGYEWTIGNIHGNVFMAPDFISATTPETFYPELFIRRLADLRVFGHFNHPAIEDDSDWDDWVFSSPGGWCMTLVEARSEFPPALSREDLAGETAEYVEALERGWLIGVDGSKDTHDDTWGEFGEVYWQKCNTVALATSLTREKIINALQMRRTYVSQDTDFRSNPLIVEFRASKDGGATYPYIMGEALDASGVSHVMLQLNAHEGGEDYLSEMRIYKNGSWASRQTGINGTASTLEHNDGAPSHGDFYFGVVIEADGEVALTSPIFIRNGDTDSDGLADEDEINSIGTNPNHYDTDGDGFSDGDEISLGTDPLDPGDYPALITPTPTCTATAAPTITTAPLPSSTPTPTAAATATGTPTVTPEPCIDLRVSAPVVSNGDRFFVDLVCYGGIDQMFDAYCVILFPDGSFFSLIGYNKAVRGLTPWLSSIASLRPGYAARCADLFLKGLVPGEYTQIVGAMAADTPPRMDAALCYSLRKIVVR